jgi:hypothetical protein
LDIFIKMQDGTYEWKPAAATFEVATSKIEQLATAAPGDYVIFDQTTGTEILVTDDLPERSFRTSYAAYRYHSTVGIACVVGLFALAAVAFLGCGFMLYTLSQWMLETDSGDDTGKPTSATGAATAHQSWSSVERSRLGQRSLVISRETSEEAVRSFSLLI